MKDNSSKDNTEWLRFENELKKIKISLEQGAIFSPPNKELPPEVERQWLESIRQFEEAYKNRKTRVIYDKIGRPEFRSVDSIPYHEVKKELDRIQDLLNLHDIQVSSVCEVDDRELYRFIIRDLFAQEIEDIPVKGMISHFIYEDFYPNHEYDIQRLSEEAVQLILDKEHEYYSNVIPFTNRVETKEGVIDSGEFIKKVSVFRDKHEIFEINDLKLFKIYLHENIADVNFYINYLGTVKGGGEKKLYAGEGRFDFIKEYGYWSFYKVNFPGI